MLSCVIGAVIYYFFPLKLSRFNLCRRILPSVRIDGGFYSIRSLASLASPLHFIPLLSSFREITLHHYERLHFIITRDYTSSLREISLHCCERLSIWIIQPAVYFYRRFESTERFIHSLDTLLRPLSLLSASRASPVHSYGVYATFPFYTLDSIITRDYTSLLREIKYFNYTTRRPYSP
jgi:hypothetical protein